jgi:hypothetical protein
VTRTSRRDREGIATTCISGDGLGSCCAVPRWGLAKGAVPRHDVRGGEVGQANAGYTGVGRRVEKERRGGGRRPWLMFTLART